VEALVALGLAAVAAGTLAAVATASGTALVTARRDGVATALATERLDGLRAGPRTAGSDAASSAGSTFARRWTASDGRGRPDGLGVEVAWPGHRLVLATEALP
jgi:hypothetical protein